ncbi:hypothetical protein [Kaarinaea lacus]
MSRHIRQVFRFGLLLFVLALSIGCATVNEKHPMLVTKEIKEGDVADYANVYFIRPKPFKPKGVADYTITVDYQDKPLLTIDEGSYTLLRIKPGTGKIKVNSETKFTNKLAPIKVWRARQYKFIEGKTYFIHLKRVDEEFRGIFYEPQPIKYQEAKVLADDTLASGEARSMPIDELVNFSEPPESAFEKQAPALPENIYKPEPYLKKSSRLQ